MASSSKEEYLSKARVALGFAEENLRAANALRTADLFSQGFGLLLYAAEESTKAAIYLYANADLITFEIDSDKERLYFNEEWLTKHKEKYNEFARVVSTDLVLAAIPKAIEQSSTAYSAVVRVVLIAFIATYFLAWGDRFEELREMSFLSGPPVSGKTDVQRPGQKEFEAFEPIVRAQIERIESKMSHPFDRNKLAEDLPSREVSSKFVVGRSRKEDLWKELQNWLEAPDTDGSEDAD